MSDRTQLAHRLTTATADVRASGFPLVVVDVDAFDANAADLTRRAGGTPIRLASKSVRVPALIERALAGDGFHGVLGYQLREGLWLVRQGLVEDYVLAYPTVDAAALDDLLDDPSALAQVTLMVDDPAHLDLVDAVRRGRSGEVRVCIDADAGLRLGPAHVGPKRSPLAGARDVGTLARLIAARPGFRVVGVMTYEGQVAGVQDDLPGPRSRVIRGIKKASVDQLTERRAAICRELAGVAELEFFNAGGSGSVETTVADPSVSEVAAGSGLTVPSSFDHFRSFRPQPAAYFGVPVVRRPGPGVATVAGGGFIASGPTGKDRSPLPWAPPGLSLTGLEGAGEVQTPLTGKAADALRIGDLVWFRHAKAGELMEHTTTVHLLRGEVIQASVPTYRGLGFVW